MKLQKSKKVIVVGGGASGIIAAIAARRMGAEVKILERNPRIGKKILVTGNGRCNFTNIHANVHDYSGENREFVTGALSRFSIPETIAFFEKLGIAHKVEDNGKVFPMSDQASSILDVLLYELKVLGVNIVCGVYVSSIKKEGDGFLIETEGAGLFRCDRVVLACGGKAMPSTGSDGNGYGLAKKLGHSTTEIFPALVQLKLEGKFFKQIDGVKFVGAAAVVSGTKTIAKDRGDILFTNYGISGPPILQISRKAGELLQCGREALLQVTVLDNLDIKKLEELLASRFNKMPHKTLEFALVGLINKRLIPVVLRQAGFSDLKVNAGSITSEQISRISKILKCWQFKIKGTKSWPSAQVTAGGIRTSEIDPGTLESKIVKGLFFAGEIIDIDGKCGGYNLQWAWSSGYVSGQSAAGQ
ncbi:MAG: NAD(P)/FAD-dependent oxidoreductase [Tepidanaerobacteraceae bacterium]|jgi:predicted Rossmann fold flavoprotein